MKRWWRFLRDEQGQDLIEYSLLIAFVCLAACAFFIPQGQSMTSIWSATYLTTQCAASLAASS